ncbi:hypothetical protein CALCODRAFT_96270 [Calocera cornea HHB12733]|uniref:Uncharacterized protein n=1 Tax=Calocera cornea HHB12733 TaxID=1353952 RepID=A0A165IJC5_9BASI|nr:hypothetical protein CALCODRAFT_96270 [Calocera cornea HHB12733]
MNPSFLPPTSTVRPTPSPPAGALHPAPNIHAPGASRAESCGCGRADDSPPPLRPSPAPNMPHSGLRSLLGPFPARPLAIALCVPCYCSLSLGSLRPSSPRPAPSTSGRPGPVSLPARSTQRLMPETSLNTT